jgi:hypothetical protein
VAYGLLGFDLGARSVERSCRWAVHWRLAVAAAADRAAAWQGLAGAGQGHDKARVGGTHMQ